MFFWACERKVTLAFIEPGQPTQNAFIESSNGKFRDGCLNQHGFLSLADARHEITQMENPLQPCQIAQLDVLFATGSVCRQCAGSSGIYHR
ncbi:integrase core domain-containing protein [Billgrantia diversa]|uniref:integrase core domain-containing protein n=1 Tax=Halomonas sp. MCCC 1A13316 TaxID=2733487 RepID=UPI003FA5E93E